MGSHIDTVGTGGRFDGALGVARGPAEALQRLEHLGPPRLASTRAAGRRDGCRADAVLQLDHDPLGALAADAGHGREHRVVGLGDGATQPVGGEDGEHREGDLGPDAAGGLHQQEHVALVGVGEPVEGQGVLADDQRGGELGLLPQPQPGDGAGRAVHEVAEAGHVDDGGVEREGGHLAADVGDHRRQPHHHGRHLCLVGAPAARDGRLNLAGRVQLDVDPVPRGHEHRDRARLRGAHDGADVVLAEHPLDGHDVRPVQPHRLLEPLLEPVQTPGGVEVRSTSTCTISNGRPTEPCTTPRPSRVSPGSTASTRVGERMFER